MGQLTHFDDRTIRQVRARFTGGQIGSGDDPIASHTKMIQDHYLGNLEKLAARAENKAYDTNAGLQGEVDTRAEIDPTLSYDENVALLKEDLNVSFKTEAYKTERDAKADEKQKLRQFAAKSLQENFDAIEAGEKTQLVDDIGAEISPAFVDDVLAVERAERASDTGSLPDPEPVEVVEPKSTPEPAEPVKAAEPEPTPEPVEPVEPVETVEATTPRAGAAILTRAVNAVDDAIDSLWIFAAFVCTLLRTTSTGDSSASESGDVGMFGFFAFAVTYPLSQFRAGAEAATAPEPAANHQATLSTY